MVAVSHTWDGCQPMLTAGSPQRSSLVYAVARATREKFPREVGVGPHFTPPPAASVAHHVTLTAVGSASRARWPREGAVGLVKVIGALAARGRGAATPPSNA